MEAKIKGSIIRSIKRYITINYGADSINRVLAQMDNNHSEAVRNANYDALWEPEESFIDFLYTTDKILGHGNYSLCKKIGTFLAKDGISKFYRFFIEFGKPSFVLKRANKFWKQLHNTGYINADDIQSNSAICRIYDYGCPHKAHCVFLLGYFTGVLEMTGVCNIQISETKCTTEGNDFCEYFSTWEYQ